MSSRPRAAFFNYYGSFEQSALSLVFGADRRRLESLVDLHPRVLNAEAVLAGEAPADLEVGFATWGMPGLDAAALERLPRLRAVFYAAGTVREFARPLLDRGIVVCSAWAANAVPVAEFASAQILLSLKRVWAHQQALRQPGGGGWAQQAMPGAYRSTIGLVGFGQIARRVRARLQDCDLQVLVHDPYLASEQAARLGVQLVDLETLFATADVVSLHAANLPATRGMVGRSLLERLRPHATLINTARGALIREDALVAVWSQRPDLTALLDVTDPEPPHPDSPLRLLPNVFLTPHIAGSMGPETQRMAAWMVEEFEAWRDGRALRYAVTPAMLETMA